MLSLLIKHYIYDIGLNMLFDNIIDNFNVYVPSAYLGRWWTALDKEDGELICWGKCIEHEKNMVVLDDGEAEYIVHLDVYNVTMASERQCELLNNEFEISDEELMRLLNEDIITNNN